MKDNFEAVMAREYVYEGGYVNNPKDPGGRTNRGVTQAVYNAFRLGKGVGIRSVKLLTDDECNAIYRNLYWNRIHADEYRPGVDLVLMDAAINSGVAQCARWVQHSIPGLTVDGDFGPQTREAIRGINDDDAFIDNFLQHRLGTLETLTTFKTFGKGWKARIANVKKIGQEWAQGSVGPAPVDVTTLGGHAKADVADVKRPFISTMSTQAVAAGGMITTGAGEMADQLQPLHDTFHWVPAVIGGLTLAVVITGIIVKMAHNVADAAQTGARTAEVDNDADTKVPEVQVTAQPPVLPGDDEPDGTKFANGTTQVVDNEAKATPIPVSTIGDPPITGTASQVATSPGDPQPVPGTQTSASVATANSVAADPPGTGTNG